MRIALLEDDPDQAELLIAVLESADHACQHFDLGEALVRQLGRETYDLMILDWLLPDIPGDQILRTVRERLEWPVPVIFVTQRDSEEDVVHALESGADDYMAKPVKPRELLARVSVLGRRSAPADGANDALERGSLRFDLRGRTAFMDGEALALTETEFKLAAYLFQNPGRLLSRAHILESVWGRNPEITTRTVDVHVSRLRRKLDLGEARGWVLKSIYQQGYRLESTDAMD